LIVDTNIFLDSLSIAKALPDWVVGTVVVVALAVIRELDGLKKSYAQRVARDARQAITFLTETFATPKQTKFRGQTEKEFVTYAIGHPHRPQNADDWIINCCQYYKQAFNKKVSLITEDKIMRTKGRGYYDLNTYSLHEFIQAHVKVDFSVGRHIKNSQNRFAHTIHGRHLRSPNYRPTTSQIRDPPEKDVFHFERPN